jgi:hypothetical protein
MDNFDLKKYLSEGKLNEQENVNIEYPEEILNMDREVAELKAKLESLQKATLKAKSSYTKTIPSLFGTGEYAGMANSRGKREQYRFKDVVDFVKKISEESGNNWKTLESSLRSKYGNLLGDYTKGDRPVLYVTSFFLIVDGEDEFVKINPSAHIKIGTWYIRPW